MTANPWAWQDGRNPYLSTPFQVLDVSPTVKGRGALRRRIATRRRHLQTVSEQFPLFGRILGEADVNEAEALLAAPGSRLLAELCTHRPRYGDLKIADLIPLLPDPAPRGPEISDAVDTRSLAGCLPALPPLDVEPLFDPAPPWRDR